MILSNKRVMKQQLMCGMWSCVLCGALLRISITSTSRSPASNCYYWVEHVNKTLFWIFFVLFVCLTDLSENIANYLKLISKSDTYCRILLIETGSCEFTRYCDPKNNSHIFASENTINFGWNFQLKEKPIKCATAATFARGIRRCKNSMNIVHHIPYSTSIKCKKVS